MYCITHHFQEMRSVPGNPGKKVCVREREGESEGEGERGGERGREREIAEISDI